MNPYKHVNDLYKYVDGHHELATEEEILAAGFYIMDMREAKSVAADDESFETVKMFCETGSAKSGPTAFSGRSLEDWQAVFKLACEIRGVKPSARAMRPRDQRK